uniref:Uncharacterized protein n=1 Tax=Cyanothece sp. (strain PCC 7425 / ATCC 29141) TaxID=395961 RepID=B8HST4_CYAP4
MASLFDENFKYTKRADEISRELQGWLHSFYAELLEEGFSPREVTVLVTNAVTKIENDLVVEWEATQAACHR